MAGHALEEKDSVCLVQDGVWGTAGVAEHVPGKEKINLRNQWRFLSFSDILFDFFVILNPS